LEAADEELERDDAIVNFASELTKIDRFCSAVVGMVAEIFEGFVDGSFASIANDDGVDAREVLDLFGMSGRHIIIVVVVVQIESIELKGETRAEWSGSQG